MLTTRTFKPTNGRVVHVVHETRSMRYGGTSLQSLCGSVFHIDGSTVVSEHMPATCAKCKKYDNPFSLSNEQLVKFWTTVSNNAWAPSSKKMKDDLLARDLITEFGQLTPRGAVLARDLKEHPPWPDDEGVMHARNAISYRIGACTASLSGLEDMTFSKLDKMHALTDLRITCVTCLAEVS